MTQRKPGMTQRKPGMTMKHSPDFYESETGITHARKKPDGPIYNRCGLQFPVSRAGLLQQEISGSGPGEVR